MNVAVFMPNWIGDAVMATPALRALRDYFQGGRLIGVLKPYVAGVLEGGPWFDEIVLTNGGPWSQSVVAVAAELRRAAIDVAILMPNSFRSALTAWLGGCRRRVGYSRFGRSLLLTDALPPIRDELKRLKPSPVLDAYNLLAERVGCSRLSRRMELFTTPADEAASEIVWHGANLGRYAEVVCLNAGAAFGAAKHWPDEHFAALACDLVTQRNCGVLVLCGPTEREQARRIAAMARHPSVTCLADLAPALSLGLTKACVRRAHLLITTDSGPRHFAAAFDRPVVTLFGPTHIAWTETFFARAVHLQKGVPCGPCQQRTCHLDHACMKTLLPAEVLAAALGLLSGKLPLAS